MICCSFYDYWFSASRLRLARYVAAFGICVGAHSFPSCLIKAKYLTNTASNLEFDIKLVKDLALGKLFFLESLKFLFFRNKKHCSKSFFTSTSRFNDNL